MPRKQLAIPTTTPRLAAARYQRGWSQQHMADLLGTTPLNISRWERGITRPNPYFRQKLASLFDMNMQEREGEGQRRVQEDVQHAEQHFCWDPAIPVPTGLLPLIGREQEAAQLKAYVQSSRNMVVSALSGLPGVGKTALALAMVYDEDVRRHFADGILWAGLGPHANPSAILSRWGRLLGMSDGELCQMRTPQQWASSLQARIGQRRMLLVLDDVWDVQEALACQVGGPRCAYLLTTRLPPVALALAGNTTLTVPELDEEASLCLLRQLAPQVVEQEPQQVLHLLRQVGGLPLALRLVGNHLRMQSYNGQPRRIRAALEQLSSSQARLLLSEARSALQWSSVSPESATHSLQEQIAVSERHLSSDAQNALRSLATLPAKPHSFTEEEALAACGQLVEILDELSDAGLLESQGPELYSLHPVIVDYARLPKAQCLCMERRDLRLDNR